MYYFKNGNFLTVIVVFHFSSSKITFARKKKNTEFYYLTLTTNRKQ